MTDKAEPKPSHKGLYSALAAAQAEMGRALKDSVNPGFKSKYADLASVCDACMPALSKHGIAVLQPAFDDESGRYVKTIFVHGDSGETVECRVPLIVAKNDMQGYGSAATYARRYGLMGMAGIAPEDDDGNAAAKAPPAAEPARRAEPARQAPQKNDAAVAAVVYLGGADTDDDLIVRWRSLPDAVKDDQRVIDAAKKARKDIKLAATQAANPDLGNDAIPY